TANNPVLRCRWAGNIGPGINVPKHKIGALPAVSRTFVAGIANVDPIGVGNIVEQTAGGPALVWTGFVAAVRQPHLAFQWVGNSNVRINVWPWNAATHRNRMVGIGKRAVFEQNFLAGVA